MRAPTLLLAVAVLAVPALAVGARAGEHTSVAVPLPRKGDVSLFRYRLVAASADAGSPTAALLRPPRGVGVFTWVGHDPADSTKLDLLVGLVNPYAVGARGSVGISLSGRGAPYEVVRAESAQNAILPRPSLICSRVQDTRDKPLALARGGVPGDPLTVFASICALAADGPAPLAFVRSFGGFYCSTAWVNTTTLAGPGWQTSCTKPFASAQIRIGPEYALGGVDRASAPCTTAGQVLSCRPAAGELTKLDTIVLMKPVPGASPTGLASIRRSDGERLDNVVVVQYPGEHQHG
jgi:hypothetical protein